MNFTTLSIETFVLCATNDGAIYESAKACARYAETLPAQRRNELWQRHIEHVVLPCLTGNDGGFRGETIRFKGTWYQAALALADYYARKLAEDDYAECRGWYVVGRSCGPDWACKAENSDDARAQSRRASTYSIRSVRAATAAEADAYEASQRPA